MKKNNIRSIRFSDELAELIDRQIGNSFTEKFENLITRCVWELPAKEKELQRINQEIRQKRQQLAEMSSHYCKAARTLEELSRRTYELERIIYQQTEQWDM